VAQTRSTAFRNHVPSEPLRVEGVCCYAQRLGFLHGMQKTPKCRAAIKDTGWAESKFAVLHPGDPTGFYQGEGRCRSEADIKRGRHRSPPTSGLARAPSQEADTDDAPNGRRSGVLLSLTSFPAVTTGWRFGRRDARLESSLTRYVLPLFSRASPPGSGGCRSVDRQLPFTSFPASVPRPGCAADSSLGRFRAQDCRSATRPS